MIDKRVSSLADMVADCPDVRDGAIVLIGGFGDAGVPEKLIDTLRDLGLRNLTVVSNNAGSGDYGLATLLKAGCVGKMVCSFPRSAGSIVFEELYLAGILLARPQNSIGKRRLVRRVGKMLGLQA